MLVRLRLLEYDAELGLFVRRHDQPSRSVSVLGILQLFEAKRFRKPTKCFVLIPNQYGYESKLSDHVVLLSVRCKGLNPFLLRHHEN
jgi:hypothetical protein